MREIASTTVVTSKGQVVIPARLRKKLNIKKGTRLLVEETDSGLSMTPITAALFEKLAGALGTGGKLTQALLAERAKAKVREAKR